MTIQFRCEHCGKKVEAPDSAGGKRGRCPSCKQSNYIPGSVSDDELYDLAPESEADRQRTRKEAEALRRQEEGLLAEMGDREAPPVPLEHRQDLTAEDLHHLVVNYCLDLATNKLDRAQTYVAELRKFPRLGFETVDDFLSGKALEPALDAIPAKILQGFLKQLRASLA